ncbi:crotonase/enoyl-CoA hydratase family protein [Pinisolibacter sp.]|uniref:crotonase/enoyl-CoA hydratase family protein n=1 Tax=Pinisolibacter sp. TaxID=2172024 RepID=UPI002FDD1E4F
MARVEVTIADRVAEVALARPDKKNALDMAMFEEIAAAGEALKRDRSVRAVVLTGQGADFCAGLDLAMFRTLATDLDALTARLFDLPPGEIANLFQKPSYVWQELEIPVIAALRGVAFGGGLQIALGADIRIAAPDVRLSVMEIRWGLVPDMGITQALRRLTRIDVAKDLLMTGRIVAAEEARDLGLLTRLADDPLAAAHALARDIAARSPDAVRRMKALLDRSWFAPPAEGLRLEAAMQHEVIGKPAQLEAVAANLAGRPPNFD